MVLYCGDCLDVLPALEPGSVDAVVTDPPYGIGVATNYKSRKRGALAAFVICGNSYAIGRIGHHRIHAPWLQGGQDVQTVATI